MISIPCEFLWRLYDSLDLEDLRYAYERQIVGSSTVVEYASRVFESENCDEEASILSRSSGDLDQLELLFCHMPDCTKSADQQNKKWAMILAAFVNETDVGDKLTVIDDIYSSFDYPEELASIVRYMPMIGPNLCSKEANESRMLDTLKDLSSRVVCPP